MSARPLAFVPPRPAPRLAPLLALALASGCASDEAKVLSKLDGTWAGTMDADGVELALSAEFEWKKEDELLFGLVTVTLPGAAEPSVYAVRRWNTVGEEAFLDLTDELDATKGMDLDGPVKDAEFSGDASVTEPCPSGSCGYAGKFTLEPTDGGTTLTTPPTTTAGGTP